jgi:hypothetical protein
MFSNRGMSEMGFAWSMLIAVGVETLAFAGAESFTPDGRVNPDDYTVLMAVDSPLPAGCRAFQPHGHGKFYAEGWSRSEQVFRWEVTVPAADEYVVNVLACRGDAAEPDVRVSCGGQTVTGKVPGGGWICKALDGTLRLPAGKQTIALQAVCANFVAELMSVELVRPSVRDQLQKAALSMRSDTAWMRSAGYGLMVHWTSQSFPRTGPRLPYAEAVKAFDVERFADQVQSTGAGFLVFTTSHAEMYFPAPIAALDRVLPGRTCARDLVADLAAALGKRGIRLVLYYHMGSGSDPAWLRACGFWETDTRRLFGQWTDVVGEIGKRYGESLAGWWFDDGAISYYYRSAPWAALAQAAKAGNQRRVVGYNPWILPVPTLFQDFHCGEGFDDPRDPRSRRDGLQPCATLVTEGDWGHFDRDREITAPRWSAEQLAAKIGQFRAQRTVPIFNVEIFQEGAIATRTVEAFRDARRLLK